MNDSELIPALKRVKATLHSIRVSLDGGGTTMVAVPNVRQKWQRICSTVDQLDWTRLECLDEAGSVLALIQNAEAVVEPEPVEEMALEISEQSPLGQLVRAQEMVIIRFEEMASRTFDAQNRVIEMLSSQLESQNENYVDALASMHNYAKDSADARAELLPNNPENEESPIVKAAIGAAVQGAMKGFGIGANVSPPTPATKTNS